MKGIEKKIKYFKG